MRIGGRAFLLLGVWHALAAMGDDCAPIVMTTGIRPAFASQFLEDAAKYLTGDSRNAEAVYLAYKRRTSIDDPDLPYPPKPPSIAIPNDLETLWKDLGLDSEKFTDPAPAKWDSATSKGWARKLVHPSGVKGRPRMIYRRKGKAGQPRLSIAQTLDDSGNIRETEVAVQRAGSNDWDFFVYDSSGKQAASSMFYANKENDVQAPAPLTCLACHYDRKNRSFGFAPKSYSIAAKLIAGAGSM